MLLGILLEQMLSWLYLYYEWYESYSKLCWWQKSFQHQKVSLCKQIEKEALIVANHLMGLSMENDIWENSKMGVSGPIYGQGSCKAHHIE